MNFENEQYGKCWFCGNFTVRDDQLPPAVIWCVDDNCGHCTCDMCTIDDCIEYPIPYADLGLEDADLRLEDD